MKSIIALSVCIVVCAADFYVIQKDTHTPDALRRDRAEMKKRLNCYLDEGPCSPIATAYKNLAKDFVITKCDRCTEEHLELCRAFLEAAMEDFPDEYSRLRTKYDPTNSYFEDFEKAVGCKKHKQYL